ncbi:MAG: creatininase family protein, partial [Longimicrobiales bacterium]
MRVTRIAAAALMVLAGTLEAQTTGAPFIEQMTWDEVRDAIKAGKTTVIIPVGGTEQNGPHMVMGKHNYVITFAANEMAKRLGNALVAPTVKWVPEGDYNEADWGD